MNTNNEAPEYRIWAVDNVVYGPVDMPTLISWIKDERVMENTWIHCEQGDAWRRAGQIAEFTMFFQKKSAGPSIASAPGIQSVAGGVKPGSLRRMKIFAGLSDADLERFMDFIEVQTISPWAMIVKKGSPGDAMFLVLEGEVRVRLMIGGKETILATLPQGEFFGEISLFDHGPRSADVIANRDTTLLKISAFSFQKLITDAPDLASPFLFAIGKTLTARIRADNKRFQESISMARTTSN